MKRMTNDYLLLDFNNYIDRDSGDNKPPIYTIKYAKAMGLIPDSFEPRDVKAMQTMVLNTFSTMFLTPARREVAETMIRDWKQVVQYWRENNIDALAGSAQRQTP